MRRIFLPWQVYAHFEISQKRMEVMVRENKIKFDRMMEEAERDAQVFIHIKYYIIFCLCMNIMYYYMIDVYIVICEYVYIII